MDIKFMYCEKQLYTIGLDLSPAFCKFYNDSFTRIFYQETGLKPSTKVSICMDKQDNDLPVYQCGEVSRINIVLWILPMYYDDISFCWKSKTGKIVKTTDEQFDEADLECWIEGLKPAEYWKHATTEKKSHPFLIANLPFELKVFGFGTDTILRIHSLQPIPSLGDIIFSVIENYNTKSEAASRRYGVVHNAYIHQEHDPFIISIDTGSAGIEIIKAILRKLKKQDGISVVEIDI